MASVLMSSSRSSTRRSFIWRSISPRSCLRISSGSFVRKRTRFPGVSRRTEGGFIALPVYATRKPPPRHLDYELLPRNERYAVDRRISVCCEIESVRAADHGARHVVLVSTTPGVCIAEGAAERDLSGNRLNGKNDGGCGKVHAVCISQLDLHFHVLLRPCRIAEQEHS